MSSKRLRIDEAEATQASMSPDCDQNSGETSRSSCSVRSLDSPVPATASPVPTIQSVQSLSEDVAVVGNDSTPGGSSGLATFRRTKTGDFPRFGGKPGRPPGTRPFSSYVSAYQFRPQSTIKASSANGVVVAKGEHAYAFCDVEHGKAVIEALDRKIAEVLAKQADIRRKTSTDRTRYLRDRSLLKQLNELREFRKLPKLVFNPSQKRQTGVAPANSSSVADSVKGPTTCDLWGSQDDGQ